eukprot:gene1805-1931_t
MEDAQGSVRTNNGEEAEEEDQIKQMDLLLVARRILKILDNMLSIPQDNKKLDFIFNSICDSNDAMNTIEKWSYGEFDDFGVLEDVTPHALNILKIVYHSKMISKDPAKQLEALQYFRKSVSSVNLSSEETPLVQIETTEVSSGHYTYLVEIGAVPVIIPLLSSSNEALAADAAAALGYLAMDSVDNRDVVIECGVLPVLLKEMESSHESSDFLNNSIWVLRALCCGNPSPNMEVCITGSYYKLYSINA